MSNAPAAGWDWDPTSNRGAGLTIGPWRIGKYATGKIRPFRLEHKCGPTGTVWWPWTYSIGNRGYGCTQCKTKPPEAIQAVFWMLVEGA